MHSNKFCWETVSSTDVILYAGNKLAATGGLTGQETPSLMTIGRDGAVFFWMYEPSSLSAANVQQPKRFGNIPGKRRKRKAPDSDPEAAQEGAVDAVESAEAGDMMEQEADSASDNSNSSNVSSSDSGAAGEASADDASSSSSSEMDAEGSQEGGKAESDAGKPTGSRQQKEASTSGRYQAQQSTSYAGRACCNTSH